LSHSPAPSSAWASLIPATILTGFLGSGKTTLLKRVLTEAHGQKIAVIENEFGEENIDNDILVTDTQEQIIQMSNGCICCTIREDLRETLQPTAGRQAPQGRWTFDRVVIETTGLADPGPVAQTFFMDDEIAETYLLDSILTLVDAKHAQQQLDDRQEARRQVGFADQIFISKTDLVSAERGGRAQHRLKHMNPRAPHQGGALWRGADQGGARPAGFNLNAKLDIDPDFLKEDDDQPATATMTMGHVHHDHDHHHDHPSHGEHCTTRTTITTTTTSRASSTAPTGLRPGQAGRLPGRHRQHLRPAHAALQGRAAHEGHRAQGDLPGRAPAHGQRPGPEVGAGRKRRARWCSSASTCRRTSSCRGWTSAWSEAVSLGETPGCVVSATFSFAAAQVDTIAPR
jgi:G3E family GTPase